MAAQISIESPVVTGLLDNAALETVEARISRKGLSETESAAALWEIRQSVNRLQALELKVIQAAGRSRAGAADGLVNVGAWVARESRVGGREAARSVRLASSLESLPHADVIATAAQQLRPCLPPSGTGWRRC